MSMLFFELGDFSWSCLKPKQKYSTYIGNTNRALQIFLLFLLLPSILVFLISVKFIIFIGGGGRLLYLLPNKISDLSEHLFSRYDVVANVKGGAIPVGIKEIGTTPTKLVIS